MLKFAPIVPGKFPALLPFAPFVLPDFLFDPVKRIGQHPGQHLYVLLSLEYLAHR
jgi:hypothetical protein